MFDTHGPVEGQESRSRLLAWARAAYARSTDHRDRDYYAGMIDAVTGDFAASRCAWWRDPVNVPERCYGGRDALGLLEPRVRLGRMRHGG